MIALQTISRAEDIPTVQGEREIGFPRGYSTTVIFDPDQILPGYSNQRAHIHLDGREMLSDKFLRLYEYYGSLVGLASASNLALRLGTDQIVDIRDLKDALTTTPSNPVSLDKFDLTGQNEPPPLLLVGFESPGMFNLPTVSLQFFPHPQRVESQFRQPLVELRDSRRGERMSPTFIPLDNSTPSIGHIDSEQYRTLSPVFALLAAVPSSSFEITAEAIDVLNQFSTAI